MSHVTIEQEKYREFKAAIEEFEYLDGLLPSWDTTWTDEMRKAALEIVKTFNSWKDSWANPQT